jgi:LuxR family maltose regulon positive regulatory protein
VRIVSVVAPAGYGKTTLLSQWAGQVQDLAWVSLDQGDNDPKVLLAYIAQALDAVEPLDGRVFEALASPSSSVAGSVIPRLSSAFSSMTKPLALVLDDVHVLHKRECWAGLSVLADHVPIGSLLVLAGRTRPVIRIARLRAEGRISEIGPAELSLTADEASSLLHNAGVTLGREDVEELHERTEGWAAGLYLAALYLREGGSLPRAVLSFGGDDRLVGEYIASEFLTRVSHGRRAFLTRTAVLERLCGPLCEAVLDSPGSRATLADLAQSNMLLVPLDRRGEWYRYHHLFREALLVELEREDPELIPELRRRAARWCMQNSLPEEALEYSIAAGDVDTVAQLLGLIGVPVYRQGRIVTMQRWFRWLDEQGGMESNPMATILASIFSALMGRPLEAERWADAVDRWQYGDTARTPDPPTEAWAALLRAFLCRQGVERMRVDAREALVYFGAGNFGTPTAALMQGFASILGGDPEEGDALLAIALGEQEKAGAPEDFAAAAGERALLAMARGEWDAVATLAEEASAFLGRAGMDESVVTPLVSAIHARLALHRGDTAAARRHLVTAQRSRPVLTYALPYLAVQSRIELIRVHLSLADPAGARTLMREIDDVLRRRPDLGTLAGAAESLRVQLSSQRGSSQAGASTLTAAELRLLPLLSTHLLMPEIAEEVFLSRHTVKSEAMSIYRKLGVSSRSQAVARAREMGLLD